MQWGSSTQLAQALRRGGKVAAVIVLVGGFAILVGGWWLDLDTLRQPLEGYSAVRAAAAAELVLVGGGLLAYRVGGYNWLTRVCALVVMALSTTWLLAYATKSGKLALESWISLRPALDQAVPGQVALNTAVALLLLGIGLSLLGWHKAPGVRQSLGAAVFTIAYAAFLGLLSGSAEAASVLAGYTQMAPPTAVLLMLSGSALVVMQADRGWASFLTDPLAGGRMVRTLLPVLLGVFALGAVVYRLLDEVTNLNAAPLILVLLSSAATLVLVAIAARLEATDAERAGLAADLEGRLHTRNLTRTQADTLLRYEFAESLNGQLLVSLDGRILDVNRKACELLERERDFLTQATLFDVFRDPEVVEGLVNQAKEAGGRVQGQVRVASPQGGWILLAVAAVKEHEDQPVILMASLVDISELLQTQADLKLLAGWDKLTGLANRNVLLEELNRSVAGAKRSQDSTGVLMIDLDHFKDVNDSLGHGVGDQLLQSAARRLESCVREGDLVGRLGGDEFFVILKPEQGGGFTSTVGAGWRIVRAFREPFRVEERELYTTTSVGAAWTHGTETGEDLIREADTAMYAAKAGGRDRVEAFNPRMQETVTERRELEADLRQALSCGQLQVWYHPEVSFFDGKAVAAEALLRWQHPSRGLVSADKFIEIAESTGMIVDIGNWVLDQAIAQAAAWSKVSDLVVRVNLSAVQLANGGLLEMLDAALERHGLNTERLCLEITETSLLRTGVLVSENLEGIRARGIRLAVDDFGTGYASLAYLRDHAVDVLKIDKSFVANLQEDEKARRLVRGLMALAKEMNLSVVAEGVETEQQAIFLKTCGCPGAQGFLYSKAVPADKLTELLERRFDLPK